jgi:ketosteroid isomerase-like protein
MSLRTCLVVGGALWLALACRPTANGQQDSQQDLQSLLATDREWAKVAGDGRNADSVLAYWTEDARVVMPGAPILAGKPAIRGMVEGSMKTPGFHITWMPDSGAVSRSGDLGYTYGTNEFTAPDSTGKLVTTRGRYLTVWRKDSDGRWRCVEDIASPGPATVAAAK